MGHFVSVKLRQVDYDLVCEIARREGRPYCDVVNRAVQLYHTVGKNPFGIVEAAYALALEELKEHDSR